MDSNMMTPPNAFLGSDKQGIPEQDHSKSQGRVSAQQYSQMSAGDQMSDNEEMQTSQMKKSKGKQDFKGAYLKVSIPYQSHHVY